LTANRIRILSDPRGLVRVCNRGKHDIPTTVGSGAAYDWEVTDKEFNYWHSLEQEEQDSLKLEALDECFLCVLERRMSSDIRVKRRRG